MKKLNQKFVLLFVFLAILGWNFLSQNTQDKQNNTQISSSVSVVESGSYTSKDEVASYIYTFNKLPKNFITKKEAQNLGWDAQSGNLAQVAPGKSIGGDRFGNREGKLPNKDNRKWFECDIDYQGGRRGAKRIVFSNDGLIYYTPDHYKNFYLLFEKKQL